MQTPESQDLGRPVLPDLAPFDRWQVPERLATWPGEGKLPPRKARPTPLPILSAKPQPPSPKAAARRAAEEAEIQRTFAGVAPGAVLPKFGQRQRVLARARLSRPYARALRVVAWKLGRKSGRVPLNPQSLAIVEAVAAQFRAKEVA